MPLLGRHKSSQTGANQNGNKQQPINRPAVCESPLFGTRRQLPINSPVKQQTTSSSSSSSISKSNHVNNTNTTTTSSSSNHSTNLNDEGQSKCPNANNQEDAIGSVPQNITRQQIHYAFSIMDTNSDGLIDLRDLSQMLANLGVPIDEAILSHVMSTVSKRDGWFVITLPALPVAHITKLRRAGTRLERLAKPGDHLISEAEFLVWIGNFIQVSDETCTSASASKPKAGQRSAMVRSSTAGSSLAAQSPEVPPPGTNLRQRRGSGSGLALMRSLSSSSGSGLASNSNSSSEQVATDQSGAASPTEASRRAQQDQEARNDLKAAFCVFDLDGDGFITLDEVRAGLKLLGESWTPGELAHLFSQCKGGQAPGKAAKSSSGNSAKQQKAAELAKQRISIDDFVHLLL